MASTPHHSFPLAVLGRRAEDASDAFPANVQYALFSADGNGWRSQLRTIRSEFITELARAMANDVDGPRHGFCVWESFRELAECHLAFDVDLKPGLGDKTVKQLVTAVSSAVASAFAANFVQRRVTRFDCIVWCASRPGKASYHLHYYRLRMSFAEQLSVARWVREQLSKDAAMAWLYVAFDVGPNERGHLRTPLSHKFDDGHLQPGSCLLLDGIYDRAGEPVPESRRDRCFWSGHAGSSRMALLVEGCLHSTSRAPYHDLLTKDDSSGPRKKWTVARARARSAADDVVAAVDDDDKQLTGIDMCDWRPETMVPAKMMVVLQQHLSNDDDPYTDSVRWFAQRATVVGNTLYYKVMDKASMPTLEPHPLQASLYAQFPKVTIIPERQDKGKNVSFLQLFVESHLVREHYRDLTMVPRGVSELECVDAQGKLNQWTGWKCDQWRADIDALDAQVDHLGTDDSENIHYLLFYLFYDLCNSNEEHFRAVVWYLAHLVQHPSEKTGRILVIYGPEGCGKSGIFVDLLLNKVLGRRHSVVLNSASDITGQFNSLLEGRIVCVAEEAMMADARSADALKDLVTGDTITINRKMVAQRQDSNYLNVILLSNNEIPLVVGKEARRPIIIRTSDRFTSMADADKHAYFEHRAELLENDKSALQFAWFLSRVDLAEWSRIRKSKLFYSREFDAMRVASLSPGLKLAFSIINAGSMGGISALDATQDPEGWWTRTLRSPWFEERVKEHNGDSHLVQQDLIKLGCSFGTNKGAQFIAWPPKKDFLGAFRKMVPGIDTDRLNVAPVAQPRVPHLLSEGPGTELFKMMRPLTCEQVRSLERAHSRAQMSQGAVTPPLGSSPPPARRQRRRRVVDSDDDDLLVAVPRSRSPSPLGAGSEPSSPPHPTPQDEAMDFSPRPMVAHGLGTAMTLLF